jgi:hypothetical protein
MQFGARFHGVAGSLVIIRGMRSASQLPTNHDIAQRTPDAYAHMHMHTFPYADDRDARGVRDW